MEKSKWGLGFEISYQISSECFSSWKSFKQWLFKPDFTIEKKYRGKSVFWPRGVVTILGLSLGAGLFLSKEQ